MNSHKRMIRQMIAKEVYETLCDIGSRSIEEGYQDAKEDSERIAQVIADRLEAEEPITPPLVVEPLGFRLKGMLTV